MDYSHQAPPSMEFSRQEYWSGLPFPSPGDLPNPGIKTGSLALKADSLQSELLGKTLTTDNFLYFQEQYLINNDNLYIKLQIETNENWAVRGYTF